MIRSIGIVLIAFAGWLAVASLFAEPVAAAEAVQGVDQLPLDSLGADDDDPWRDAVVAVAVPDAGPGALAAARSALRPFVEPTRCNPPARAPPLRPPV